MSLVENIAGMVNIWIAQISNEFEEPIPDKQNRKYIVIADSCFHVTLHGLVELLVTMI